MCLLYREIFSFNLLILILVPISNNLPTQYGTGISFTKRPKKRVRCTSDIVPDCFWKRLWSLKVHIVVCRLYSYKTQNLRVEVVDCEKHFPIFTGVRFAQVNRFSPQPRCTIEEL